ncbi:gamma-glutamyltransferase [Thiomicrorhabdus sediminis]|uniref:Glutathione hydrolase proenzyme n=2 Tax=Thiomicrorhabdus sediminis TaxID=2580412 RepID=A0A4P9K9Z2_9GAMM|nr:gamma-glutamyltransferase [Thiomicrorhabdus sediminis]
MLLAFAATSALAQQSNSHTPHQAAFAMPDKYSAQTVKQIFAKGGNAVDAAIAAGFSLAVTYPEAGNLGGGGFMTIFNAKPDNQQHSYFLDYREKAPIAATETMYLDENGEVIPYRSLVGYRASGVPGTVMGMWQAHQKFGTLPWSELLQPAIDLAQNGFQVSPQLESRSAWYSGWIADKSTQPLNFNDYFSGLKINQLLKQPELAQTLSRIAEKGVAEFYRGKTADLLVKQMQQGGGLITHKDLASYQAVWRQPVIGEWNGMQIVSAPPPSSGGVAIIQLLKMQKQLEPLYQQYLADQQNSGLSEQAIEAHFYAEMAKRVYADRAYYLGDSDFVYVPITELISDDYLFERASEVNLERISDSAQISHGKIETPETTHFSIVDPYGNAVSNTYTLNMPFGNGVVIEGAGFLMNDEMDDFSTKPGVANVFGVVGGKANAIAPQKRMLSSMSPTIVLKDNRVDMVVGTPGGSTIITSVFQTIMNVYKKGMSVQQAVDAPRVHHQLLPINQIAYNPELPDKVKDDLLMLGYNLKKNNYMGDVQMILHTTEGYQAASDVRGEGVAGIWTAQ